MPEVQVSANGDGTPAYLARPAIERAPGVVVLQEWWGLDDHIRSVCDRLASAGVFALAPDVYGRMEPMTQPDEAQQRMLALSMDDAEKDMIAAAEYLVALDGVEGEHVGALGFCLGGGFAVWATAASPLIGAIVSYYYVMPDGTPDFSKITGSVLGRLGRDDEFVSLADARALEAELSAAGVEATFEFYENGGHAFVNDTDRLGTYDPDLAARSWERTVAFLRDHLTAATA